MCGKCAKDNREEKQQKNIDDIIKVLNLNFHVIISFIEQIAIMIIWLYCNLF